MLRLPGDKVIWSRLPDDADGRPALDCKCGPDRTSDSGPYIARVPFPPSPSGSLHDSLRPPSHASHCGRLARLWIRPECEYEHDGRHRSSDPCDDRDQRCLLLSAFQGGGEC